MNFISSNGQRAITTSDLDKFIYSLENKALKLNFKNETDKLYFCAGIEFVTQAIDRSISSSGYSDEALIYFAAENIKRKLKNS